MGKDKNYWHTNKEIPENGSCVLWKAKLFSKERGNIEGGRYDQYYDCFCGSASLFVNRSSIKQWIYCKDIFDILDQNTRLQKQLDREIHINRKMKSALEKYAFENTKMEVPKLVGYSLQPQNEADLNSPMVNKPVYDGVEEVEFPYANDTSLAQQVLKEIDNKE